MELASQTESFRKRGIGVAAIVREPVENLKRFADKHRITYAMLADHDSAVIKRFGLVDPNFKGTGLKDIPYAGNFMVDPAGTIRQKFFEPETEYRWTAASILMLAGEPGTGVGELKTDHFSLRTSISNTLLHPGQRIVIALDLEMQEKHHAYAPGAGGYRPLTLRLADDPLFVSHQPRLPKPKPYFFAPLNETVPVYEGRFRLLQEVSVGFRQALARFGEGSVFETALSASLDYQICSDRVCYPPGSVALRWPVTIRRFVGR